jgi:2-polyprenyl-6-hydroxyphenyl methylase/3-demethylubiquinone-9 3-methyltransferase
MGFKSTISKEEVERFDALSSLWWDEKGPHAILHAMNICRLAYIKEQVENHFNRSLSSLPFQGLSVLDVGCGGGIVCEPMARLGAQVTGCDASPKAVDVAVKHAAATNLSIDYRNTSIEHMAFETYDVILALEIIEHVENPKVFLEHCKRLLKPGGVFIASTLNRTWKSYLGAIVGAEYVLRMVPPHTHQWHKFVTPSEMNNHLQTCGLDLTDIKGMEYSLINKTWRLSSNVSMNYILMATAPNIPGVGPFP